MQEQLDNAVCGYLILKRDGQVVALNQTLKKMLGLQDNQELPNHMHQLLSISSRVYFQTYFLPLIDTKGFVNEIYLNLKSKTGKVPVLMNAVEKSESGRIECAIIEMSVRDCYEQELLQEQRKLEKIVQETDRANVELQKILREVEDNKEELYMLNEQLQRLVLTDALTGLANRRHFDEELFEYMNLYEENKSGFSLMIFDIDFFKKVNDTFGHQVGDIVLQELSVKAQSHIADTGFVARIGGEEFAVIMPNKRAQEATEWAEAFRRKIEESSWLHTPITISVGVTDVRADDTRASVVKRADDALYNSKESGRNRVTCY